jgi:hypothetical protein
MLSVRKIFSLSVFFMALSVASPSVSIASDADFVLKNRTGYQIDEVYVSKHSSKNWGPDVMGTGALGDGENVKIVFPHGSEACHFDIKVKYHDDGSTAEWGDVNLCDFDSISLYWDANKQVTRAVGE